jgi:carnitine 3-dehydrogenase
LEVKRVASIGGGPIGAGWAAHFLARGYDVTGYLHAMGEESIYRRILDTAWVSLTALGLAPGASLARLTLTDDLDRAVADAELHPVPLV